MIRLLAENPLYCFHESLVVFGASDGDAEVGIIHTHERAAIPNQDALLRQGFLEFGRGSFAV